MASTTTTLEELPATQLASSAPTSATNTASDSSLTATFSTFSTFSTLYSTPSTPSITMATPSPSSTIIPTPGLSTGAKAGIAAASAVGLVVLLSFLISLHISYRKKRDTFYRREKDTPLSAYGSAFRNTRSEGGAPLLRDGSYMDLSNQNFPNRSSQHGGSPMLGVSSDDSLSPRRFENSTPYAGSTWLSPTHKHSSAKREENERWRESHSIAGYFETRSPNGELESPRMSKGDKMVAEWNRMEIEIARERSMDREREERKREPHPMAAYQIALPPFFPRGFRDISGDTVEPVRNGDHYSDPGVHEMDVGVEGRRTER